MGNEIIARKLYQIQKLLKELRADLGNSKEDFLADRHKVGTAERNFQLIVNLAIDINGIIITSQDNNIPDTYQQSFLELGKNKLIDRETARFLAESAKLRNILVHEYNFDDDPSKFYDSAKRMIPVYEQYVKAIFKYTETKRPK